MFSTHTIFTHRQYIRIYLTSPLISTPPSPLIPTPISEITPFGPLCKVPKSPLKRSFLYRQSIYAIFTT